MEEKHNESYSMHRDLLFEEFLSHRDFFPEKQHRSLQKYTCIVPRTSAYVQIQRAHRVLQLLGPTWCSSSQF